MRKIRFSPWLIFVLAIVMVLAAGCVLPDPQVAIETPQPMTVPQQPAEVQQTSGTPAPGVEATTAPGGETTAAPAGAATPTLPAVIVATTGPGAATEGTPAAGGSESQNPATLVPTVPPPQPTAQSQAPQAAPTTAVVNAQGNTVYTVKPGETLFSIGRLYNVNPYSIAAANNIPYPYIIYPGQQLIIPTGGTVPPGPTPIPPQPGGCRYYHTVRPGENLFRISLAYGVPMATIAAANGIVNYNLIYAGQTLCIP